MEFSPLALAALGIILSGAVAAALPADLSGHWRLNTELSDAPPVEAPAQGRGSPGKAHRGRGGGEPPPMGEGHGFGRGAGHGGARREPPRPHDSDGEIAAARSLVLTIDDRWLTLSTDEGRSQRFVIGGTSSTPLGGTTHTEWQGEQLVLRGEGAPPLTRRFSLAPDGRHLLLRVETETANGRPVQRNRIYDRVAMEE